MANISRLLLEKLPISKLEVLRLLISLLQKFSVQSDLENENKSAIIAKFGRVIFQSKEYSLTGTPIKESDILAAEKCMEMLMSEGEYLLSNSDHDKLRLESNKTSSTSSGPLERHSKGGKENSASKMDSYSKMHMRRVMLKGGQQVEEHENALKKYVYCKICYAIMANICVFTLRFQLMMISAHS